MRRLKLIVIALTLVSVCTLAPWAVGAQRLAPIVGKWNVVVTFEGTSHTLVFKSDGEGVYGRGTGRLTAAAGPDGETLDYPVAWDNRDPGQIRISGEATLLGKGGATTGTLIVRTSFRRGGVVAGDALLVDTKLVVHRGTVTMSRLVAEMRPN